MQNKKRNIIIIIASAAVAVAAVLLVLVHVEKNVPESRNQVVSEAMGSEESETETDTESKESELIDSAYGDIKSEKADVQKSKGNNAGISETQEEISDKKSETIISGEIAEADKAGENIVQEVTQNEISESTVYEGISSSSGTIYPQNSDIEKVEYGVADDNGDYDKSEPESKPSVEIESKAPDKSESKPSVNPESKPSVEPESKIEAESESETESTRADELPTRDIDLNTIIDYDTYESLTGEERTEIRKSFDSIIAYNDWLQQLIQKRNNKITEGAVGYGEEIVVE